MYEVKSYGISTPSRERYTIGATKYSDDSFEGIDIIQHCSNGGTNQVVSLSDEACTEFFKIIDELRKPSEDTLKSQDTIGSQLDDLLIKVQKLLIERTTIMEHGKPPLPVLILINSIDSYFNSRQEEK